MLRPLGEELRGVPNEPAGAEPLPAPGLLGQLALENPHLDEEQLWGLARDVTAGIATERRRRLIRRLVDDDEAAAVMALDRAHVVNGAAFIDERHTAAAPCLGGLVAEGHNALLVAAKKTGKSTFVENASQALVSATPFLGIFDVHRPYRVALLNFEMTVDDLRSRIRARNMTDEQLERLLPMNLRGVGLSLTAPAGRRWLVDHLRRHRTEIAILDTYGAASAPSIESENDNAGGRRFLMVWDSIKAEAGVHTSLVTHHTGRGQLEGEEHGRGASVVEDWADVILTLTRDRDSGHRFLSSEGRSPFTLPESRLFFDPDSHALTLPDSAVGESRRHTRESKNAELVARVVADNGGIISTALRRVLAGSGISKIETQARAIETAKMRGLVHTHPGERNSVHHFSGAVHADADPCPDSRFGRAEP